MGIQYGLRETRIKINALMLGITGQRRPTCEHVGSDIFFFLW